jgi:hypothetical protein
MKTVYGIYDGVIDQETSTVQGSKVEPLTFSFKGKKIPE